MKNQIILIAVVTLLIGTGVGFFAGTKYQQGKTPARGQFVTVAGRGQGTNRVNSGQFGGGTGDRGSFRPVNGEITSADDKTITVKMTDGGSRIVILNDKTTINKAANATKADLTTGQKVAVFGTDNADGSVTAQSIQLNPTMRFNGGPLSPTPTQ